MKKFITSLLILFFIFQAPKVLAQTGIGNYRSGFGKDGNTVQLSANNADLRLTFCSPSVFRVQVSWNRQFGHNEKWMVTRYKWPDVPVQTSEHNDRFIVETGKLTIIIHKSPVRLDIETADGQSLVSEEIPGEGSGGGFQDGEKIGVRKKLNPGEHFFGFGERMDFMDQRGKKVELNVGRGVAKSHALGAYNILKANYSPVPFFMSTRGYGIFMHNAFPTTWDMGHSSDQSYSVEAESGPLDYYFMYGPDFPSIIDEYTSLTGKSPLIPRFALGLNVGTYSGGTWGHELHVSSEYVKNLGRKFRDMDIPADVLHLDSTWRIFGKLGHGGTTFEWRPLLKNPASMIDSLYDMNYHMVGVHIRPFLDNGKQENLLDEGQAEHVTYPTEDGPGTIVNFFDSSAVNWWWKNGVMKVASIGIKFVKTDAGNAFHIRTGENNTDRLGNDPRRMHNLYPIAYAKAPYQKFQDYNGIRGFNLTREGYAGIQRFPYIFAGDWPSEWEYFEPVIKAGINIGLSGVGYWGHCMGGFERQADPELYIRWTQFGLLSPMAHLFGMDHPGYKEPWNYGDKALENFRKYDHFRYRLMPYLYTTAWQMYQTGMPIMRSLVYGYQDDSNVYNITDQYMLGKYMMVCPVVTKGADSRVVYLPKGTWFDYWSGKKYEGQQNITVTTPLEQIPIFVKAGAIIPQQKSMAYIGAEPVDRLNIEIFPYGKSSYTVYDDDGKSLKYKNGQYALTHIKVAENDENVSVTVQQPNGNYEVPTRSYSLKVHLNEAPDMVKTRGQSLENISSMNTYNNSEHPGWHYDADHQVVEIRTGGNSNQDFTVQISK